LKPTRGLEEALSLGCQGRRVGSTTTRLLGGRARCDSSGEPESMLLVCGWFPTLRSGQDAIRGSDGLAGPRASITRRADQSSLLHCLRSGD
jgi:hypothetical protein